MRFAKVRQYGYVLVAVWVIMLAILALESLVFKNFGLEDIVPIFVAVTAICVVILSRQK